MSSIYEHIQCNNKAFVGTGTKFEIYRTLGVTAMTARVSQGHDHLYLGTLVICLWRGSIYDVLFRKVDKSRDGKERGALRLHTVTYTSLPAIHEACLIGKFRL